MAVDAVGHAADDGVFVGLLGEQGHEFADSYAVHVGGNRLVERAAIIGAGLRLRIESIQVGRSAPHPDLDDGLGFGLGRWGSLERAQTQVVAQQQAARAQEGG